MSLAVGRLVGSLMMMTATVAYRVPVGTSFPREGIRLEHRMEDDGGSAGALSDYSDARYTEISKGLRN